MCDLCKLATVNNVRFEFLLAPLRLSIHHFPLTSEQEEADAAAAEADGAVVLRRITGVPGNSPSERLAGRDSVYVHSLTKSLTLTNTHFLSRSLFLFVSLSLSLSFSLSTSLSFYLSIHPCLLLSLSLSQSQHNMGEWGSMRNLDLVTFLHRFLESIDFLYRFLIMLLL